MAAGARDVLYVEDDEDDVVLLREFLPVGAYRVSWASNAASARRELSAHRFDLVLLDHGLPDSNSLLFLDEIRRLHPELPVLILTGRDDEALAASAIRKGADGYMLKSELGHGLAARLDQVLGRRGKSRSGRRSDSTVLQMGGDYLKAAPRVYQVLLSMMNDGCLLIDAFGIVTFANDATARFAGAHETEALLGRPAVDLFDLQTAQRLNEFRAAALDGRRAEERFEGRLADRATSVLVALCPVEDKLCGDGGCLAVLTDITEMVEARKALEELDRLRSRFVSTVSHELRTPMAAISGAVDNLLDGLLGELAPEQRKSLELILRNSRRLGRLIDNLLDRSRIEAGIFEIELAPCDLLAALRQAIEEIGSLAERHGVTVEPRLPEQPVEVLADPDRLVQITLNLLDNAIRFAVRTVRIELLADGKQAVLRVSDDGPGIAPARLPQLFEPFSVERDAGGKSQTGLGLSIVRDIVQRCGGSVAADNLAGGGACFTVRLPLAG